MNKRARRTNSRLVGVETECLIILHQRKRGAEDANGKFEDRKGCQERERKELDTRTRADSPFVADFGFVKDSGNQAVKGVE
jgi:hypothetical protein